MSNELPKGISEKRVPIDTPDSIVNQEGKFNFGTFKGPFKNLNMLDAKHPVHGGFTKWFKNKRLKDWEAIEIAFDEGFLVAAIYDLGITSFNVAIFFDEKEKKSYAWQVFSSPRKINNHWTLIDSEKSLKIGDKSNYIFKNNFEKSEVKFDGFITTKENGGAFMDFKLTPFTEPSNVCIPFKGKNRALYSHKEVFRVDGTFKFGDRVFTANKGTLGIIDDHKGYYPYTMKYYWTTGFGTKKVDGKDLSMGFNLTENQSVDPYNYNENILWLENKSFLLPPVHFTFSDGCWHIRDEYDMVHVDFYPESDFSLNINALIIKLHYCAPHGRLVGYIRDYEGNKYDVSGLSNMGEDKEYHI